MTNQAEGVPCNTHGNCRVIFRASFVTKNGQRVRARKGKPFPIHLRSGRKR